MGPWGPDMPVRPDILPVPSQKRSEPHCWNCCDVSADDCHCDCPYCDCRYADRLGS